MSAAPALRIALYQALSSIARVSGRVFEGRAPQGSKFPRITLSAPSEVDVGLFQGSRSENGEEIHLWGQESEQDVLNLYAEVKSLLHGNRLAVGGYRMVRPGTLRLITVLADPDGKTWHGVAQYETVLLPA
jgi:hypothetical protein